MDKKRINKKAIALILVLVIIASILTGILLVAQTIIRYSQISKGVEVSEKAYFAAETAIEIAGYDILKNKKNYSDYTLSGVLSEDTNYQVDSIELDSDCPAPSTQCSSGPISNTNPWSISLSPGWSFQLNLDINGATYPTSLSISTDDSSSSELILSSALKTDPPLTWSQTTYPSWPVNLILSNDYYYKLRINNLRGSGESINYTITPSSELVIGLKVQGEGVYSTMLSSYKRIAQSNFPRYQFIKP